MTAIITKTQVKRPVGRPHSTAVGIKERIERYKLAELCAEYTPEVVAFWGKVLRNEKVPVYFNGKPLLRKGKPVVEDKYTFEQQFACAKILMERAYGMPISVLDVDQTTREQSIRRIEVKWLPPDPADTSKYIAPEPD